MTMGRSMKPLMSEADEKFMEEASWLLSDLEETRS
jgi:hypothetical protein